MTEQPSPFRCSFMDLDAGGMPCGTPAKWACRIDVGPWMLGWWGCDDHKPYLEALIPVLSIPSGGYRIVPVMGMITRSPLILSMEYLVTGQQGQPIMTKLTCDKCGKPIYRYEGQWLHIGESGPGLDFGLQGEAGRFDHKALPG